MRIVAISDQHGHRPSIPPCDLLLVAGDQSFDTFGGIPARVAPARQWEWFLNTWLPWRYEQPVDECLVTWGNHDYCGLAHTSYRTSYRGKRTTITCDQLIEVLGLRVYLTPWSNSFMSWAFMREPAALARYYSAIPAGLDILVSHQPPEGCGDHVRYVDLRARGEAEHHFGSAELREAILRVRPRVVVSGHIHYGYGRYDCDGIPVYNVSLVNEAYAFVNPPTDDGRMLYVRFRWGYLSVRVSPTPTTDIDAAVDGEELFGEQTGGGLDGVMTYDELVSLTYGVLRWPPTETA